MLFLWLVQRHRQLQKKLISWRKLCQSPYLSFASADGEEEGEVSEVDRQRSREIDYLRKLCLPQLVLLLHSVLHNTGQFERAIAIADLIASEKVWSL